MGSAVALRCLVVANHKCLSHYEFCHVLCQFAACLSHLEARLNSAWPAAATPVGSAVVLRCLVASARSASFLKWS